MPKKPRRKQRASKPKRFEAVPKEFHTVTPYLAVNGAAEAIEWYEKAFGAKELERQQVVVSEKDEH
jgi:hypothetical protein